MHTKTLIEAIAQIKSRERQIPLKAILDIFTVYETKFTRLNVLTFFEDVPATFVWANEDSVNSSFNHNGTIFRPKTVADFISLTESLGYDLSPRFNNDPNSPSVILWNNDRGIR